MRKTIRFGLIIAAAFLALGFTGLPCGQETQIPEGQNLPRDLSSPE